MVIRTVTIGPLETNCYIVIDEATNKAIVIDPGDEPDRIMETAEGAKILYIVLTHAHFDHVGAVADLKNITGAKVIIHAEELEMYETARDQAAFWGYQMEPLPPPDILFKEGDELSFGNVGFVVIHTPGHTPGSICLYSNGVVITGDTLFRGSVGRTDFPGGDINQLRASFRKLMGLPDETAVLAGHGPPSTIGVERVENLFSMEI
jgi:glyoxylase-like metal-dependent hydrolase (beta-lactamase superfamily II)